MKQNNYFRKALMTVALLLGGVSFLWAAGPNPYVGTNASSKTTIPTSSAIDMETGTYYDYNTGKTEHPVVSGHTDWCEANAYVIFNLTNSTAQRYNITFEAATNNDGAQVQLEVYTSGNESSPESGTKVVSITKAGWNTFNAYNVVTDALPTGDLTFKLKFLTSGSNVQNIQFEGYAGTTHRLTVVTVGTGTVAPGTNDYEENSVQTLTASPGWGWDFTKWTDGSDNQLSTSNPYNVTVDADKTVKAVFTQRPTTLDIPSNSALDIAVATTNNGTFKMVSGKTTFDSFNPNGYATLKLNVTEAGAFNFAFKACTSNDGNSMRFDIVDDATSETEVTQTINITNNHSWDSFDDYSFEGILTTGPKTLTITFLHDGSYTSNAEELVFTLKDAAAYNENATPSIIAGPANVTLTRSITADKWSTIVLPFDIASSDIETIFGSGASVAELSSGTTTTLNFTTTLTGSKMKANQPYAIKVSSAFSSATVNGVTIESATPTQSIANWDFVGTYANTNVPKDSYFFSANKLYQASAADKVSMKPFRGYFTYTGGTGAPMLNFIIDGNLTGIAHIDADGQMNLEEGTVYNLNGQRVAQTTKGLYIVNGKKVIIK